MQEGKTALVTGPLGVLGRAIVTVFLEDGFRTVLVDLDRKKLEDYSRRLPRQKSLPSACDISQPGAVDAAVNQIRESWGSVDVLVNKAGILVKRFYEPEEVAHAVRFLVHPLAGFITGEVIDQNGGLQFD